MTSEDRNQDQGRSLEVGDPPSAAIYLRVSTAQQTTDNQEPECLALVAQNGWRLFEVYREQESAAKKRPIFEAMLEEARSGRFRYLVVWRLDRFGRRMQGNINDVLDLDRLGVQVVSVREPWMASGGSSRNLLLAIFSWLAEEERRVLIERVRAGMARAKAEGKTWGHPPVSPERLEAAARDVRRGAKIAEAAAKHGVGKIPVLQVLAMAAAEDVRRGMGPKKACRRHGIAQATLRNVLSGRSYLCRYPDRRAAHGLPDRRAAYRSFAGARDLARSLDFKSKANWIAWTESDAYLLDVPKRPERFYKADWRGWPDWLGYSPRYSFAEARAFVHAVGLKSGAEWLAWRRTEARPRFIPAEPRITYAEEFVTMPDWLGYEPRNCRGHMMPFEESRQVVRGLKLRSEREYQAWAHGTKRNRRIAANPEKVYAKSWRGWPDWLGYEPRRLLSFQAARRQVRELRLGSRREWDTWARSGARPRNIPAKPGDAYTRYWRGMADWLGFKRAKPLPFFRARKLIRAVGLRSHVEWLDWCRAGMRPPGVPADPSKAYRVVWRGWRDWFGTAGLVAGPRPRKAGLAWPVSSPGAGRWRARHRRASRAPPEPGRPPS